MKLLKLTTFLVAASMATGAVAQQDGGRLDLIVQPEPPGLMLGLVQNGPTQMVAGQIYEGLLRYNKDLEPQPSLAKEWEIAEDGMTYTFKLQEGVTWHDGEPFTSADVVFSTVFLQDNHARFRGAFSHVESVEAPDDLTVVVKMKQPYGPFINAFEAGSVPIVPKHIYEGKD